jgi:hypothetical protein
MTYGDLCRTGRLLYEGDGGGADVECDTGIRYNEETEEEKHCVFLYRLEAQGEGFDDSTVIVLADGEKQAFSQAEALLEKSALGLIKITEFAVVEENVWNLVSDM